MRHSMRSALVVVVLMSSAGCAYIGAKPSTIPQTPSASPTSPATPSPMASAEPVFEALKLSISNGTTEPITLVVNAEAVGPIGPHSQMDPINPARLPVRPWHVEARLPSGRVLLSLDVRTGDVWHSGPDTTGHSSANGVAVRADLSCGRLDVWSGPPLLGPMPPESFPPGDCDP